MATCEKVFKVFFLRKLFKVFFLRDIFMRSKRLIFLSFHCIFLKHSVQ